MRPLFLLLCLGCLSAAGFAPRVKSNRVAVHLTAGTVWVVFTVSTTGAPDSTVVAVTGPTAVRKKFTTATKTDSVSYPRPAEGATIGGTVTPTPYKGGLAYSPGAAMAWTYTEPVTPKATVTEVHVVPISFSAVPGGAKQLCTMVRWDTGEKTRVIAWPEACEPAFQTWLTQS